MMLTNHLQSERKAQKAIQKYRISKIKVLPLLNVLYAEFKLS